MAVGGFDSGSEPSGRKKAWPRLKCWWQPDGGSTNNIATFTSTQHWRDESLL